jgi:CRISPR-associated protein Csb2
MGTTLAIKFPLGRYHATPWDRSVNEGTAEWPPSPWRLLRALVATWYTRWPDLPVQTLDGLLDALGDPPSYLTPAVRPAHTRHYLPDLSHRTGQSGRTDLTLDPFLWLPRNADLLVRWEADLSGEQRAALAKLAELLPYLGRADSVCEARLLDSDHVPDETWWRPGAAGTQTARLLAPVRPVRRAILEMSTVEVRKARRAVPQETMWVSYAFIPPAPPPRVRPSLSRVRAVRFAVVSRAPLKSTHGVLLADEAHRVAGYLLEKAGLPDQERRALLGTKGAATDHAHAHWVPIADGHQRGASVQALVLWVAQGMSPDEVAAVIRMPVLPRPRRGLSADGEAYEVRGFPDVRLLLQAAGTIEQAAPELCEPARHWRSLAPYLPVRHRKRESFEEFLTADVCTELRYRDLPPATVTPIEEEGRMPDRWASEFRRYRMTERMGKSRPGLGLRLEFAEAVRGPLLLGQLSHFGYGIFEPE